MPKDPRDMTREEAARAGLGWTEGEGAVAPEKVERAAKEGNKMFQSLVTAAKGGYVGMVQQLFSTLLKLDPSSNFLTKFLEMFLKFIEAGGAEAAQEVAEALFSEENVEIARALGRIIGENNTIILQGVRAWTAIRDALDITGEKVDSFGKKIKGITDPIIIVTKYIDQLTAKFNALTTALGYVTEALDKALRSSGGGGEDGNGGWSWMPRIN